MRAPMDFSHRFHRRAGPVAPMESMETDPPPALAPMDSMETGLPPALATLEFMRFYDIIGGYWCSLSYLTTVFIANLPSAK